MKHSIPSGLRFWLFAAVAALVCSSSRPAFATTYYVNSNATYGNDTHAGTSPTAAWKTLARVSQQTFNAGDIVAFRRGQSWSGEVGQSSPACVMELNGTGTDASHIIRATSYDSDSGTGGTIGDGGSGALPILYGIAAPNQNGMYTVLLQDRQYWTIEDLDIRGGQYAALAVKSQIASYVAHGITIRNLNIQDTSYGHYTSPSDFWWQGNGMLLYNAGASQAKFDGLVVDHCTISNCWARGIRQENNVPAVTTDQTKLNTSLAITYNNIHDTRSDGIWMDADYDFLFDHNIVDRVGQYQNTEGPQPRGNFTAVFWTGCLGSSTTGCRAQYNTVSNTAKRPNTDTNGFFTDNLAFDLDHGNAGQHIIQYNLSHDNAGGFLETLTDSLADALSGSGVTDRLIVRFNISYRDDLNAVDGVPNIPTSYGRDYCPLIKPMGRHQEFYHNTFYCGTGLAIVNRVTWGGEPPLEDGIFKDNIFYATPTGKIYICKDGGVHNPTDPNATNTLTLDHNCYCGDTAVGGATGLANNTSPLNADPVFRNAASPTHDTDLQLMTTSPAWNAGSNSGVPNPVPQLDYFAYAYDQGLTIGADVFEDIMRFRLENNLTDNSGHGNNGTNAGTGNSYGTAAQSHSGNACLVLNGSGWVTTTSPTFGDEVCADLWVYPTTSGSYRRLVDKITPGGHDGFLLDLNPTNNVRWIVGWYGITSPGTGLTVNQWSHVEATYTRNGTLAIYINGVLSTSAAVSNDPVPNNSALSLLLGADQSGGSRLTGRLDDVKIRKDGIVR